MPASDLDQIVNLCKRRGFVYPSAEIYGGFRSSYDYGPLGSLMLRNVKDAWVRSMVQERDDVTPPKEPSSGGWHVMNKGVWHVSLTSFVLGFIVEMSFL